MNFQRQFTSGIALRQIQLKGLSVVERVLRRSPCQLSAQERPDNFQDIEGPRIFRFLIPTRQRIPRLDVVSHPFGMRIHTFCI